MIRQVQMDQLRIDPVPLAATCGWNRSGYFTSTTGRWRTMKKLSMCFWLIQNLSRYKETSRNALLYI